jgi:hypothetical protein
MIDQDLRKPFLYLMAAEGEMFVNLNQIVRTSALGENRITLHMSDGHELNFKGDLVPKLLALIGRLALTTDGVALVDAIDEARSQSSSASLTEGEPRE